MRFEEFIGRCRTEWPEFTDPKCLERSRTPSGRELAEVLDNVPGMATENKLKLLNLAVAALEPDEVYVEVGCYKGASLVGAALGNHHHRLFACDNFSQFDGAADSLRATLGRYTPPGQVQFFDMDFRKFMEVAPWQPARIGAYFYDGGHSFADQYDGLRCALPHFSSDAVIVIDDTNKRAARAADQLMARQVRGWELILNLRTPRNHHPTWWNGIQVYRYRRSAGAVPNDLGGSSFAVRKFIYDDIFLNLKHRRRALRRDLKAWLRAR
jgi:hypothetical protein